VCTKLSAVRANDLQLIKPFHVLLRGQRQKRLASVPSGHKQLGFSETCAPNWRSTRLFGPGVFRNRYGTQLSRFGVLYVLRKYVDLARVTMPTLGQKSGCIPTA
jgi:hypothetical protein